ncbi:MAG: family 1 glycosylhydrolase [Candidatus Paceibacterota bacterium]
MKPRFWHLIVIVLIVILPMLCTHVYREDTTKQKQDTQKEEKVIKKTLPSQKENVSIGSPDSTFLFPKNFIWGVATSAFQSEGGDGKTDWDAWDKYQKSNPIHPGFTKKDIVLAHDIGIQELRFSIEWAKVEPEEGVWDNTALTHYQNLVREMQRQNIRPFLNLHHFTLPQWLTKKGGLENDSFPYWYARYAKTIAYAMKPFSIMRWMTFNEPVVPIETGYLNGDWPPFKSRDIGGAKRATWNIIRAHKRAYLTIHKTLDTPGHHVSVGMAYLDHLFVPDDSTSKKDQQVVDLLDFGNSMIIRATEDYQDFIGLNYYNRSVVNFSTATVVFGNIPIAVGYNTNPNGPTTENGSAIYPRGIYELILKYRSFEKPIIIAENGIWDSKDNTRRKFIVNHLRETHRAMQMLAKTKSPVIGYFYWTLFDNYEWSELKMTPFGLIAVDPKTLVRTPRSSASLYHDIIRTHGVTPALQKKYLQ